MTAAPPVRRVARRLAPKVEVSDLARDQPPAASAATEVFDFEQALARLETKLQKAAPGDRLAIFRADAREVFWPVRMSVGAILTHIYGLANKYNLSGPDFIDQPAIDEIVEEITRLETEQRADEPIEDGDDVLERGPDDQSVRLVRGDSLSGKKAPLGSGLLRTSCPTAPSRLEAAMVVSESLK
jgi:hypothetical protein